MTGKQSSSPMDEDKSISKRHPKFDFIISSYKGL